MSSQNKGTGIVSSIKNIFRKTLQLQQILRKEKKNIFVENEKNRENAQK